MGKRKVKDEEPEIIDIDDGEEGSDSEYAPPKPKQRKTPTPTKDGKKSPARKREPPRPKVTETQTTDDGWTLHPPSLIYKIVESKPNQKIAAFDFDGTLANTNSGAKFPLGADDWKLYNNKVPEVVQQFSADGYKIVIFSNQGGIKGALNGKASENARARFNGVIGKLKVPVTAFMATNKDGNRKPETGMWEAFVREGNGGQAPDLAQCFFVGDAAGREGDEVGDSDLQFAKAIGIGFRTPDELFGPRNTGGRGAVLDATGPNADLANIFLQLADHFKGEMFKARAFKKASAALQERPEIITSEAQAKKLKIPGIGKGSLAVIKEFLETGKVATLDPENIAKDQQAKNTEAKQKATGDAFAFL
jgi:bifunctional polynucleotide phosphatase/kinase